MGSDEELAAFVRREYPRLVGALRLHCGDPVLAEDFAQEALARACDRWPQVRTMTAPRAWVYRVAVNLSSSWFRRRRAEARANRRHGVDGATPAEDPATALALRRAIGRLPQRQRTAVVCRYYLGVSTAETAEVMRVSEDAVRQHLSRAVKWLRAHLDLEPAQQERSDHAE